MNDCSFPVHEEIHEIGRLPNTNSKLVYSKFDIHYIPIYKKGNKTDCSDYRGISLLPTTYKILSSILLSSLTPYTEEIIGDHQCGF